MHTIANQSKRHLFALLLPYSFRRHYARSWVQPLTPIIALLYFIFAVLRTEDNSLPLSYLYITPQELVSSILSSIVFYNSDLGDFRLFWDHGRNLKHCSLVLSGNKSEAMWLQLRWHLLSATVTGHPWSWNRSSYQKWTSSRKLKYGSYSFTCPGLT